MKKQLMIGKSLNTKVVLLVMIISIISITVLSIISINIAQEALKKDAVQRLNVIASDRILTLKSIWNLRMQQVESLASDNNVISLVQAHSYASGHGTTIPISTNSSLQDQERFIEDKKNKYLSYVLQETIPEFLRLTQEGRNTFYDVRITDKQGNLIAAIADSIPSNKSALRSIDYNVIDKLTAGDLGLFYSVEFDESQGSAALVIVAPIYVQKITNENSLNIKVPIGAIIASRDINIANIILGDKRFLAETGEVYLVDEVGLMLTDSRFDKSARYKQTVDSLPVKECLEKGADVNGAQYVNYGNRLVFGASQCERDIGVVLLSELDNSELFEPVSKLQERYTLLTMGIIAVAAAVSFYLSSSVLQPLQKLRAVMTTVQKGQFQKTDIVRADEIGDLAKSFNSMIDELEIRAKRLQLRNDILAFMSSRLQVQADKLVKADREKEEFSAMISHELKIFLVPIIGYCELILDGSLGQITEKQRQKIQVILDRAWSLQQLIQNILDARRLESGDLKMNIVSDVSPKSLVEESINKLATIARSRGVRLVANVDGDTKIACDPAKIIQILDNLIDNAINYTAENNKDINEVEVSARMQQSGSGDARTVIFAVKDSGIGISEEKQKTLFKKFYHLDTSLTRNPGGKGLGLVIAKSIIEAHKGKLWLDSKLGIGSTFYFSLPVT